MAVLCKRWAKYWSSTSLEPPKMEMQSKMTPELSLDGGKVAVVSICSIITLVDLYTRRIELRR